MKKAIIIGLMLILMIGSVMAEQQRAKVTGHRIITDGFNKIKEFIILGFREVIEITYLGNNKTVKSESLSTRDIYNPQDIKTYKSRSGRIIMNESFLPMLDKTGPKEETTSKEVEQKEVLSRCNALPCGYVGYCINGGGNKMKHPSQKKAKLCKEGRWKN